MSSTRDVLLVTARRWVPGPVRHLAGPMVRRLREARDHEVGVPLPPWALRRHVPGDYRAVGKEFLPHLVDLGGLRPDDRVLDIGGRAGRMAIPLLRYLGPKARYESVDDWDAANEWCRRHVSPLAGNFHFLDLAMVTGGDGERRGGRPPEPLPFADGTFDFVTLASINHLEPRAFDYYLGEAARILAPGGKYFGTWYLWDRHQAQPAPVLACTEDEARARLGHLKISVDAVHRGSWDGHTPFLSYQDVVIGTRS